MFTTEKCWHKSDERSLKLTNIGGRWWNPMKIYQAEGESRVKTCANRKIKYIKYHIGKYKKIKLTYRFLVEWKLYTSPKQVYDLRYSLTVQSCRLSIQCLHPSFEIYTIFYQYKMVFAVCLKYHIFEFQDHIYKKVEM